MLFALFLVVVPPAALLAVELLVRLVNRRAGDVLHLLFVAGFVGVIVLHALANRSALSGPGALVVAAAVGRPRRAALPARRTGRLVPDGARACSARVPGALPVRLERLEARVRQDAVRRRAARALADPGRARRLRRVRAGLADGRRRAGERGAVSELRRARPRLDLVPERDDRPVADRAGRARGADRDPAADAPQPPADLRRPPAQRLHAPRQELPSAGDRVDHAALPSLALQERPGQLECSRLGQDGLACLGCRDRLPAPAAAAALLGRDPGHRRQLGRLRPARGPRARAPRRRRGSPGVRPERLPLHVPVQRRPQADPVRPPLAAAARAVPLLAVRSTVRRPGARARRGPEQRLAGRLAGGAGVPALPAPGRVHGPRPGPDPAAAEGEGDLRPRAGDRDRRPRRQLPEPRAAPPADSGEPPGHRVRAAVREAPAPTRAEDRRRARADDRHRPDDRARARRADALARGRTVAGGTPSRLGRDGRGSAGERARGHRPALGPGDAPQARARGSDLDVRDDPRIASIESGRTRTSWGSRSPSSPSSRTRPPGSS